VLDAVTPFNEGLVTLPGVAGSTLGRLLTLPGKKRRAPGKSCRARARPASSAQALEDVSS
jgi:hypothetical protein